MKKWGSPDSKENLSFKPTDRQSRDVYDVGTEKRLSALWWEKSVCGWWWWWWGGGTRTQSRNINSQVSEDDVFVFLPRSIQLECLSLRSYFPFLTLLFHFISPCSLSALISLTSSFYWSVWFLFRLRCYLEKQPRRCRLIFSHHLSQSHSLWLAGCTAGWLHVCFYFHFSFLGCFFSVFSCGGLIQI